MELLLQILMELGLSIAALTAGLELTAQCRIEKIGLNLQLEKIISIIKKRFIF